MNCAWWVTRRQFRRAVRLGYLLLVPLLRIVLPFPLRCSSMAASSRVTNWIVVMEIEKIAVAIKDRYKKTKFYLVSGVLVITVVGSLAAPGLTYGQKLLVFGVGGAFGIILEILHSIESRLAQEKNAEFDSLGDALPTIREIVKKGAQKIEILASDGGFIANELLPKLAKEAQKLQSELVIQIRLVNSTSAIAALMPTHWPANVEVNLKRLMESNNAKLKIVPVRYDYLPCVAGVLIDSQHLFLGFYSWKSDKILEGAGQPHIYYKRGDPKDEKYFTLFESWSKTAPES
jgi:hypothetical protein